MTAFLLRKHEPTRVRVPDVDERPVRGAGGAQIRCPRCAWEPGPDDRWTCSCLHTWNTFDTRGVCPACTRRWLETQCLRCLVWSPHDAWYVIDPA